MARGDGNTKAKTNAEQRDEIINQRESRNNTPTFSELSRLFVIYSEFRMLLLGKYVMLWKIKT